jgi:NAD-dependent dihydropyrimidine dehydrogenase PreA subunit
VILINYEDCNGCGECVAVCPTNAIILQNGKALLDNDLCEECLACIDSCPQNAILQRDSVPMVGEVIQISEPESRDVVLAEPKGSSMQRVGLPVFSSILLWTGREILPRLANMALDYLDRRIHSVGPEDKHRSIQMGGETPAGRNRGRRIRRRQRRRERFNH